MTCDRATSAQRDWSVVSERDLIKAIACQQSAALDEVYRRHAAQVQKTASRISFSRAYDVAQEIFLELWRRPERFDPARGSLGGFLAMQAHTRSIDGVRADSSRRVREVANLTDPVMDTSIDDMIGQRHDAAIMGRALAMIPLHEREAVVLAFFGDHTYRDVARLLGAPEGTIKSRIRSGLSHLRAQLTSELSPPVAENRSASLRRTLADGDVRLPGPHEVTARRAQLP